MRERQRVHKCLLVALASCVASKARVDNHACAHNPCANREKPHTVLPEEKDLLATAAKEERVANLEPHDRLALPQRIQAPVVELVLGCVRAPGELARDPQLARDHVEYGLFARTFCVTGVVLGERPCSVWCIPRGPMRKERGATRRRMGTQEHWLAMMYVRAH